MILLLALTAAQAVPPDYKVTKSDIVGCQLMLGPREADGVVPMRAECVWPDITLEKWDGVFQDWASHDEIFTTVQTSEILEVQGEVSYVSQLNVTKGISDRVLILEMKREPIEGGFRYAWTKSSREPEVPKGAVITGRSDGSWEVTTNPSGGINAVHQLSYDPGGSVPGFMVRWFQTSGLASIVEEAHGYMTSP